MNAQATAPADPASAVAGITSAWQRARINAVSNVVVVMMRKGGAGKTSVTLLTADALARVGLNVLVVDMDPQGNASLGLNKSVNLVEAGRSRIGHQTLFAPDKVTVCEVIESGQDGVADEAITIVDWGYDPQEPFDRGGPLFPGRVGTIGVIPCYEALEGQVQTWKPADLERLASALLLSAGNGMPPPNHRWDVVLIDTPPGGSLISVQAAMAAYWALFTVPPEAFGADAVPKTMALLDEIRSRYPHSHVDILGMVVNNVVGGQRLTQANVMAQLAEGQARGQTLRRAPLWPVSIPALGVVKDSQIAGAPVSAFLADSGTRQAARRVCQAAEATAIRLLYGINHPLAAEIDAAWAGAWPLGSRPDFLTEA